MNKENQVYTHEKIHIGTRGMKTAVTAVICTLIYMLIDRNPTFACIGVVFGTGSDMGSSWLNGGNRLFGTVFGGLVGMGLFSLYIRVHPDGGVHPLMLLFIFVGMILMILACVAFRWPGAVQPGGVMLCIMMFSQPVESYISYSLNRIVDTAVGVLLALVVCYLLPKERIISIINRLRGRKTELTSSDGKRGEA